MDRFLRRFPPVVLALALGAASLGAGYSQHQRHSQRPEWRRAAQVTITLRKRRPASSDHRHQENRFLRASRCPLGPYRVEAALQGVSHVGADWCRPASQQQPRD